MNEIKKQYINVPTKLQKSLLVQIYHIIKGLFLLPFYTFAAWSLGTPGIGIQIRCSFLGISLFISRKLSLKECHRLICIPLDSTRYFEFNETLKRINKIQFSSYLDISSPRILPLILIKKNKNIFAHLINPDQKDLEQTKQLYNAIGLESRCYFDNNTIEKISITNGKQFDLITCISVLEHIPEDKKAFEMMWSLLSLGGSLILTLPCMAHPQEQYINRSEYGVLNPGHDGYTFWQRYYDPQRIESIIYNIAGKPINSVVFGEKEAGLFFKNANLKRSSGILYPFWKESYMMGKEYQLFKSISQLPGEGVILLEFRKL